MISFYIFKFFEFILFLFPAKSRRTFFLLLSRIVYAVDKKHKRVIRQNLEFAFDESLSDEKIESIGRGCYDNLLLIVLQVMENHHSSVETIGNDVELVNLEVVNLAKKQKRPIVFVTAHYGNWELEGAVISGTISTSNSVYKALKNSYFDTYLLEARERYTMKLYEKRGAIRHLNKAVKNCESVSLMIDQNVKEKDGIIVKFFGKDIRQTPAPAFLARKYSALIIPVLIHPNNNGYAITFYDAIEVDHSDDAQADVLKATQAQAAWLEDEIRRTPEHWFWCHRRFKAEYPEIYKK
ncbi:MAG: lipid A biosynthesis lauroyl acyltransferase [Campylobacterota bacterium]|nr:lipid A biosynthesis lauroyl acyltransferase [Campylobacterota bacterium]